MNVSREVPAKWDTFDVIKGILAFLKEKDIPSSSPELHNSLYALKQKGKYSSFLKGYFFEDRTYYKFSRDFQTDLLNLEQSGHLASPNPDFLDYEIKPKLKNTFEKYNSKRFTKDEIDILKNMAEDFFKEISHEKRI